MQFIKKQLLKEDYSNTEEKEVTTGSKDADYKQAILTAIGSETGAWNEYNTILEMEKDVSSDLVEHFHNTIEDIRNEEMKHIGQLTEKASELPDMKDAYEAGKKEAEEGNEESLDNNKETEEKPAEEEQKEEVKESVQLTESVEEKTPDNTRRFDSDTILDIILNTFDPTPNAEQVIYQLFNGCVVNGRETSKSGNDCTETEGAGDTHDRTEHQLRLHGRQGDVPEFLPSVSYTVDGACFVKRLVDGLKTCDEGKERGTEGGPERNNDTQRHNVAFVLEEEDRLSDDAEFQQPCIDIAVGVTGEDDLPDEVNRTGNGRSVENQGYDSTDLRGKLIDEPCYEQGN